MSIEIREVREYDFENVDVIRCVCDSFRNIIATLVINDYQKIPLCDLCLDSLLEDIQAIKTGTYCYNCEHFKFSNSGWHYDGYCKLHDRDSAPTNSCKDGVKILKEVK